MARVRTDTPLRLLVIALAVVGLGCGDDDCSNSTPAPTQRFAVLSTFPGELAPLLDRTTVDETVEINGRRFRIGSIAGVPVVLGLTGIGLVNAANTTNELLDRYEVTGVLVSAVGGSALRIADVVVPETWTLADGGPVYTTHAAWLALAERLSAPGRIAFEECTMVPSVTPDPVCLLQPPVLAVGGRGESDDTFGGRPFGCVPNGGDVFGCDVPDDPPAASGASLRAVPLGAEQPIMVDMETAAIAAAATQHGVPFIAFRAVSDGAGDPLDLPGFPAQFYAYFDLAAENAARAVAAFLAAQR